MSTAARDEILQRIRSAWGRAASDEMPAPMERLPLQTQFDRAEVIDLFEERVVDYKATLWRISPEEIGAKVAQALAEHDVSSVVVPHGLDPAWVAATEQSGVTIRRDDPPLSKAELNETDGVITASKVSVAVPGTIILDHDDMQGRRALSLVPDVHVCIVRESQVVPDVPEAVAALRDSVFAGRPLTWISGGSATSDIELDRVEGVHGPRTLHVLLIND